MFEKNNTRFTNRELPSVTSHNYVIFCNKFTVNENKNILRIQGDKKIMESEMVFAL